MGHQRQLTIMLSGGLGDCLLASALVRHFDESGRYDRLICALPAPAAQLYDCNPRVDRLVACASRDLFLRGLPEPDGEVFSNTPRLRQCERRSCMDEIPWQLVVETVLEVLAGGDLC